MRAASDDHAIRAARRRRRLLALVIGAGVAATAAAAPAQDPAEPLGNYGGGTIVDPPASPYGRGNMTISLRATAGRVQLLARVGSTCDAAVIRATAGRDASGSFSTAGTATEHVGRITRRTRYKISGTLAADGASGTASGRTTVSQAGHHARRCSSGSVQWTARKPTGEIGTPGAPAPAARLYGITSQRSAKRHHAIALRISGDGRRLTTALYLVGARCPEGHELTLDAPRRSLKIASNGVARDVEHFTASLGGNVLASSDERFRARIGSTGATGTFMDTVRIYDRRNQHTLGRCLSGLVHWTAAL